jgi:flagellar hook-length control protein FliK
MPSVPATASALAASVVAISNSGGQSAVLHLNPASLGAVSVHVGISGDAAINVLFVPSAPQTAQLLHSSMHDLTQAMTSAGLNLGQVQVGGSFGNGQSGQAGAEKRQLSPPRPPRAQSGPEQTAGVQTASGARAIA